MIAPNPFDAQLRIVNGALRGVYTLFNAQGVALLLGTLDATETHLKTTKLSARFYYIIERAKRRNEDLQCCETVILTLSLSN